MRRSLSRRVLLAKLFFQVGGLVFIEHLHDVGSRFALELLHLLARLLVDRSQPLALFVAKA